MPPLESFEKRQPKSSVVGSPPESRTWEVSVYFLRWTPFRFLHPKLFTVLKYPDLVQVVWDNAYLFDVIKPFGTKVLIQLVLIRSWFYLVCL